MDLGTMVAIIGGVAATIYIVETVGKYGYALFKKGSKFSGNKRVLEGEFTKSLNDRQLLTPNLRAYFLVGLYSVLKKC
jgi:hypothetical protein